MVFCTAPVPENTEKDKEEEKTDDPVPSWALKETLIITHAL